MPKAAILILAGNEANSDIGRVVNALQTAKEFDDHGDEVQVIFDGAGTTWIPELADETHDYHALYDAVSQHVGVCDYCAGAYGVDDSPDVEALPALDDYEGHPSVRTLVAEGYEVITY
jgi:hypothetical protein